MMTGIRDIAAAHNQKIIPVVICIVQRSPATLRLSLAHEAVFLAESLRGQAAVCSLDREVDSKSIGSGSCTHRTRASAAAAAAALRAVAHLIDRS